MGDVVRKVLFVLLCVVELLLIMWQSKESKKDVPICSYPFQADCAPSRIAGDFSGVYEDNETGHLCRSNGTLRESAESQSRKWSFADAALPACEVEQQVRLRFRY